MHPCLPLGEAGAERMMRDACAAGPLPEGLPPAARFLFARQAETVNAFLIPGRLAGRGPAAQASLIRRSAPASPRGSQGTGRPCVRFFRYASLGPPSPPRGLPSPGGRCQPPSPARRMTDEGLRRSRAARTIQGAHLYSTLPQALRASCLAAAHSVREGPSQGRARTSVSRSEKAAARRGRRNGRGERIPTAQCARWASE